MANEEWITDETGFRFHMPTHRKSFMRGIYVGLIFFIPMGWLLCVCYYGIGVP